MKRPKAKTRVLWSGADPKAGLVGPISPGQAFILLRSVNGSVKEDLRLTTTLSWCFNIQNKNHKITKHGTVLLLLIGFLPAVCKKSMATQNDLQELIRLLTARKMSMMAAMGQVKALQSKNLRRFDLYNSLIF